MPIYQELFPCLVIPVRFKKLDQDQKINMFYQVWEGKQAFSFTIAFFLQDFQGTCCHKPSTIASVKVSLFFKHLTRKSYIKLMITQCTFNVIYAAQLATSYLFHIQKFIWSATFFTFFVGCPISIFHILIRL